MTKKSIWIIVSLVGIYIACQLIADVGATKMVQIGTIVIPGGTLIFALTFTLRDLIHKKLGKDWATVSIVLAAFSNILLAVYLFGLTKLPSPAFFQMGDEWNAIMAIVPAITIASIIAEIISELVDTEAYQFWWDKFPKYPQWSRVLFSNMISLPIDSIIFGALAFTILPPLFGGTSMPFGSAVMLAVQGQIVYKAFITIISLPLIYTVSSEPITFKA
jgi:queuosine precursor transporter